MAFAVVERVVHLLADIDTVKRRHGHEHMAGHHHGPEVAQEQRAQQRGNMLAVRVGVREDTHLVVAQVLEVRLGHAGVDA